LHTCAPAGKTGQAQQVVVKS